MADGAVLVVCRTSAEASAVIRASQARDGVSHGSAAPGRIGASPEPTSPGSNGVSYETLLPPDIAVTVRQQHEGRALTVITMAEVARLLLMAEGKVSGQPWEGTPAHTGVQRDEMMAHDLARRGYPLEAPLATKTPTAKPLDF